MLQLSSLSCVSNSFVAAVLASCHFWGFFPSQDLRRLGHPKEETSWGGGRKKQGSSRRIFRKAGQVAAATGNAQPGPCVRPASGAFFMKAAIDPRPGQLRGHLAQRMFTCRCRPFRFKRAERWRETGSEAPGEPDVLAPSVSNPPESCPLLLLLCVGKISIANRACVCEPQEREAGRPFKVPY